MQEEAESRLKVTIAVSGWLTTRDEVITPWKTLNADDSTNAYALKWVRRLVQ